jgi:putative zinc finger/helix-turn-helix YgiT family protein
MTYNTDLQSLETMECPNCGSAHIETALQTETFTYGKGTSGVELKAMVPVRKCLDCDFQFTDSAAEEAHHEAVCRHLEVLTPREILALRSRCGLSRSEFAKITKIGEASLQRWETGQLIQNSGYDQLLYLLHFPANMDRLRERGLVPAETAEGEAAARFPNVVDIAQARQQASAFRLHAQAS